MKRFTLRLAALIALLLIGIQTAAAQDAPDPALLDAIATAFENTRTASSLHVVSQSLTESAGGEFSLSSQQTLEADLVQTEEGWNVQGSLISAMTLPFGEFELTTEIIVVDGVTYLRFGEAPEGMPLDLPTEWVDLETFSAAQGQGGGMIGGAGLTASADQFTSFLGLPITPEIVTGITPLADDEIDGQVMQVYQLTVDSAALLESEAATLVNVGIGGGAGMMGGGMTPPQGAQGGAMPEMPEMPEGTPEPLAPENVEFTFAVYIGADDGLVHRIYSVVSIAADTTAITLTSLTDYSNFNDPVEIAAPEIGS